MFRIIRWTIIGLGVLILGGISAAYVYLQSSRPVYHGEMYHREIFEEVSVFFDRYGIPHIYANNEKDAYFTLGYIQAQERLFQMEMLRRVGAGRLAEVLGPDFTKTDVFFRTLGIAKAARESAMMFFARPNEAWQKNTLSYLKGVNAFIFSGPTPPEFMLLGIKKTSFTPEDIYLITGYMSFSFSDALRTDPILDKIRSKFGERYLSSLSGIQPVDSTESERQKNEPDSVTMDIAWLSEFVDEVIPTLPISPWTGSNAWAISPTHSVSGGVLLANDTHIGYQQPAVWYEAHLDYPGCSVYGRYLAGMPFPLIGHNRNIAWGLTMFENDDINLYRENSVSPKAGKYVYKGNVENFITRTETISIKGRSDTTIIVRESVHGPLINGVIDHLDSLESKPVSLWWTFTKFPITALQVTSDISTARGITGARNAASRVHAPGLNIVYGDNIGNIAWWAAAKLPIYQAGTATKFVLDGSSGKDDITGYLDFKDNPQSENPEEGFIVSANQEPPPNSCCSYPGYYAPPYRYDRIRELLQAKDKWKLEEMEKIQLDVISTFHPTVAKLLVQIIGEDNIMKMSPTHRTAAALLKTWNGSHRTMDLAPSVYYKLLAWTFRLAMKDELGEKSYQAFVNSHLFKNSYLKFISDSNSGWWDNINTAAVRETRVQIVTKAFMKTVEELTEYSQRTSDWGWSGFHTITHVHPVGRVKPLNRIFNVGPGSASGGIETINNASFNLTTGEKFPVTYGPAMRDLIDLRTPETAMSISPTGQSGHVRSPHYADQFQMHLSGLYRPMLLNRNDIEKNSLNELTFKPAK